MSGRRRRPLRWFTVILGTPVEAILLVGAVTGGAASCLGLAGVADAPSRSAVRQIPRQLLPIFDQVGGQYHIPWEVLAGIAANECDLGKSADPSCTLQPGATGPGAANPAGASGLMQIGIGGASGDTYQRLQPYLTNPQLGPHDPATAVQLTALTLLKLKGAPQNAPIAAYTPYVTAYNGTGPAAIAYGQRVIADAQAYQGNGTTSVAGGCHTATGNSANPLAGDTHVVAERIDMGVDYTDPNPEPIDAISAGTVTYAGPQGGGWQPNCINYTLNTPPIPTQRYVYVCEHITPSVTTSQTIQAGQTIATFIPNGGIETGWAARTRQPRHNPSRGAQPGSKSWRRRRQPHQLRPSHVRPHPTRRRPRWPHGGPPARRYPSRPHLLSRVRQQASSCRAGVRAGIEAITAAGPSPDAFYHRRIRFSGRVRALWGARDALVPAAHAEALKRARPQVHIEVWAGMGHHPQRERPTQLLRFINHAATSQPPADAPVNRRGWQTVTVPGRRGA